MRRAVNRMVERSSTYFWVGVGVVVVGVLLKILVDERVGWTIITVGITLQVIGVVLLVAKAARAKRPGD